MGHFDPKGYEEDGADGPAPGRPDDKASSRAPGSLMSLKIRKRTPGAASSPEDTAPPRAAPAEKPKTRSAKAQKPAKPEPAKPEPAADPVSRVARRVQSARAAQAAPQARQTRPARPARAAQAPRPPQATQVPRSARVTPAAPAPVALPAPAGVPALPALPGPEAEPQGVRAKRDIVEYWGRLRSGRRYPRSGDIDAATVCEHWPNSILMRCRPGSRALEPEKVFVTGESTPSSLSGLRGPGRIKLSPMMLQWLLGLAGEVVREGRPMNDLETFPSVNRVVRYRAVALPFSENERAVDHVLCHVGPEV